MGWDGVGVGKGSVVWVGVLCGWEEGGGVAIGRCGVWSVKDPPFIFEFLSFSLFAKN